jgi:hypothetical protein
MVSVSARKSVAAVNQEVGRIGAEGVIRRPRPTRWGNCLGMVASSPHERSDMRDHKLMRRPGYRFAHPGYTCFNPPYELRADNRGLG